MTDHECIKKSVDSECVEQLRSALNALDYATKLYENGALQFQPSRQFGAEMLRGMVHEVDALRSLVRSLLEFVEPYNDAQEKICEEARKAIGMPPD